MNKTTTGPTSCHECPGGCGRQVGRHHFACKACWYRLPADLRRPISATYRRDTGAHLAAMADAVDWYRTQQPATDKTPGLVLGQVGRGKTSAATALLAQLHDDDPLDRLRASKPLVTGWIGAPPLLPQIAGVPLERFDKQTARVVHGVPAWWTCHYDECDYDELYVHSYDRRRVLAATSAMIRACGVDYHEIAATETGWCRLVTECGCTVEAHDADHDGGLDCEPSGCRFPDLPPCGGLDADAWQLDRVAAGTPGAVPFTRVVLS